MDTRSKGRRYEDLAFKYLQDNSFNFIDKNFYTRFGEIDLIMSKNKVLHFIEVKSNNSFNPLLNITEKKLDRLIKSGYIFLEKKSLKELDCDLFCFSAVGFIGGKIMFVENITMC